VIFGWQVGEDLTAESEVNEAVIQGKASGIALHKTSGVLGFLEANESHPGEINAQKILGVLQKRVELTRPATGIENRQAPTIAQFGTKSVKFRRVRSPQTPSADSIGIVAGAHLGLLQPVKVISLCRDEAGDTLFDGVGGAADRTTQLSFDHVQLHWGLHATLRCRSS
jgi:hypothetical protein